MPSLKNLTVYNIGDALYTIINEHLSKEFGSLKLLPKLRSAKFSFTYLLDTIVTDSQYIGR